jgi:hypothetical protein
VDTGVTRHGTLGSTIALYKGRMSSVSGPRSSESAVQARWWHGHLPSPHFDFETWSSIVPECRSLISRMHCEPALIVWPRFLQLSFESRGGRAILGCLMFLAALLQLRGGGMNTELCREGISIASSHVPLGCAQLLPSFTSEIGPEK